MFTSHELRLKIQIALLIVLSALLLAGLIISATNSIRSDGKIKFTDEPPEQNRIFQNLVYISGEVVNPGTYEFVEGMRIGQLIELAGGFTSLADQNNIAKNINLAERVEDEQHIFIQSIAETVTDNSSSPDQNSNSNLININTATTDILDTLPGVGPATAERIISNRPYTAKDELLNVSGIGETKYGLIKDLITVE